MKSGCYCVSDRKTDRGRKSSSDKTFFIGPVGMSTERRSYNTRTGDNGVRKLWRAKIQSLGGGGVKH